MSIMLVFVSRLFHRGINVVVCSASSAIESDRHIVIERVIESGKVDTLMIKALDQQHKEVSVQIQLYAEFSPCMNRLHDNKISVDDGSPCFVKSLNTLINTRV